MPDYSSPEKYRAHPRRELMIAQGEKIKEMGDNIWTYIYDSLIGDEGDTLEVMEIVHQLQSIINGMCGVEIVLRRRFDKDS